MKHKLKAHFIYLNSLSHTDSRNFHKFIAGKTVKLGNQRDLKTR